MADNLKYLRKLLKDAHSAGYYIICKYDGEDEADYIGRDIRQALEALTACDEMHLYLKEHGNPRPIGWALIINDISTEPDEVIADYSGDWMDTWWNNTFAGV